MKKLIFFCSLLIVCACGSGGGGGSSDSDTPLGHLYEVEGRVVGIPAGYSVAVCYDRDGNKACDDNEKPFASVAADGSYKITGTAGDANNVPLIAELSPVSRSAQAFLLYETPAGQRTISVLTTLVKARMDSDPTATFDAAHSDIKAKIGGDAFASSGMDTMINTVNTIIQEMSDRLASLGYGFSRRTQLLITNIILEEVLAGNIGNNQGGDLIDGIGDIEQEMTDLEESSPKVLTVQAFLANNNLKMYMLEYYSNRYEIWNLELSTGQAKTGDGEKVSVLRANSSLPNMYDEIVPARFVNGGGFVFNIEGQDVILYSITQTPIEAIKANPRFANASVPGFPPNSFMYSINLETSLAHRAQSMVELIGIWNSG